MAVEARPLAERQVWEPQGRAAAAVWEPRPQGRVEARPPGAWAWQLEAQEEQEPLLEPWAA
jgi:hypothetical protein